MKLSFEPHQFLPIQLPPISASLSCIFVFFAWQRYDSSCKFWRYRFDLQVLAVPIHSTCSSGTLSSCKFKQYPCVLGTYPSGKPQQHLLILWVLTVSIRPMRSSGTDLYLAAATWYLVSHASYLVAGTWHQTLNNTQSYYIDSQLSTP